MFEKLSRIVTTGVLVFSVGVAPYFVSDYSYGGERMQRFKQKVKSVYDKVTRLDPTPSTPEGRARAGRIAGEILEKTTGIPGFKKGAAWINKKNESEGYWDRLEQKARKE